MQSILQLEMMQILHRLALPFKLVLISKIKQLWLTIIFGYFGKKACLIDLLLVVVSCYVNITSFRRIIVSKAPKWSICIDAMSICQVLAVDFPVIPQFKSWIFSHCFCGIALCQMWLVQSSRITKILRLHHFIHKGVGRESQIVSRKLMLKEVYNSSFSPEQFMRLLNIFSWLASNINLFILY